MPLFKCLLAALSVLSCVAFDKMDLENRVKKMVKKSCGTQCKSTVWFGFALELGCFPTR